MFECTQAIILHCQKYSDKAVILHTYTQSNGRVNFMVYGQAKKGLKGILETPLCLVELSYDNKPGTGMPVLRSLNPIFLPQLNQEQLFICMFLSEVIYKTLRQPMADERVYQFLTENIKQLGDVLEDATTCLQAKGSGLQNFMTQFSILLGYGGEWLDEWKELNSIQMLREMLN